jgi:NADH-quinone oxidoreductase subunit M
MNSLILLLLPLLFALIVWFTPEQLAKKTALLGSIVTLAFLAYNISQYHLGSQMQFIFHKSWINSLNINFSLGIDGISLVLLVLTCVLSPIIIATTTNQTIYKSNSYMALLLALQSVLIGVFLARDIFLFYFFFEITLLPVYFLINGWGGSKKVEANFRFFVFTLLGSLFMLLGILFLYYQTPGSHSAQIIDLYLVHLQNPTKGWIFLSILVAFCVKMPLFPLHSWQPDTYQQAPSQVSMFLAGLLGKMGTYGLIRILLPIFSESIIEYQTPLLLAATIGIIYGSIIAIRQSDIKRIIAFSSFAHIGLIAGGIFTHSIYGMQGALLQMVAHGINVVGLFYVAELIYRRTGTYNIEEMGGLTQKSKSLTIYTMLIVLGSVALPLTNAFVGEFLLLKSIFSSKWWIGLLAGSTIILGAVYTLRMVQKSMFGPLQTTNAFQDLTFSEKASFFPLGVLVLLLGIFPNVILTLSEANVTALLDVIQNILK